MSARQIGPVLQHLRQLVAPPDFADASDAHLLRRFLSEGDESAFELLVWRHGPMVHGLCRRVLRDGHDAEDAFQASLLVLARRAGSIGKQESVGSWLYKVAYRVALRARDSALRRARHERQVQALSEIGDPHAQADPALAELRPVLDEELSRLPEKQREAIVLCYLEGLTNERAARQLACPVGTLKTRLAQGRRLLCERLTRRGLTLAAGLAVGVTLPAEAAPPAGLVMATVRAAVLAAAGKSLGDGVVSAPVAHLMEGVLRTMMLTKLKSVAAVLVLVLAGVGGVSLGALVGGPPADDQPPPRTSPAEVRVKQLKTQIADLNRQLRKAEEDASREKVIPPRDKPIAVIFGDVPVTRDEVADYLLARMSTGQLERYLNLRILEHAAKAKGIRVTDAEVDAHLKEEMKRAGLSEQTFREKVLPQQRLSLQEWKQDVGRPHLLLKKLTQLSYATEADLRAAYEARYGEKVECRVIVMKYEERAVAKRGGDALVKAALALEPGEVSEPIDYGGIPNAVIADIKPDAQARVFKPDAQACAGNNPTQEKR